MSTIMLVCLAPFALIGHAVIWIVYWNRIQSTAMPYWINAVQAHFAKAVCIFFPLVVATWWLVGGVGNWIDQVIQSYFVTCSALTLVVAPITYRRRKRRRIETKLRKTESTIVHLDESRKRSIESNSAWFSRMVSLPFNQSFELEISEKRIEIPRLDAKLDGLTIAHLSDLHFNGRIDQSYFEHAVDRINAMDADIVAVTGDLVDCKRCMHWIPETLGRLRCQNGVYVILGNHDCKQHLPSLRSLLTETGLIHLGGRLEQLTIRGKRIVLAGNELPWITPATDMSECPSRDEQDQLRILLAHTPDELRWAQHYDFDLMLAGHTHGGQFRIPSFGPLVCPSRMPFEFACGTLYEPPTVVHVSRGLAGEVPLRINCRPEISRLTLACPQTDSQESSDWEDINQLQQELQGNSVAPNELICQT